MMSEGNHRRSRETKAVVDRCKGQGCGELSYTKTGWGDRGVKNGMMRWQLDV